MNEVVEELRDLARSLRATHERGIDPAIEKVLDALEDAASEVAKAWSGSSLGYHASVYYDGLRPPPPGAHFSQEWGFMGMFQGTTGEWKEYPYDAVRDGILAAAGNPNLDPVKQAASEATREVEAARTTLDSILSAATAGGNDAYLEKLKGRVNSVAVLDASRATELQVRTGSLMTRDTTALGQGFRPAPHQEIIGRVVGCRSPFTACKELAEIADHAAAHIERSERRTRREEARLSGSYVFIGHGRSPLWRELKDFVTERLGLTCDEFNRVPVAGVTNVERLVQMLDDAAIALLVLTAEDERVDGDVMARQNVVHEAGLFQGRLGFSRAIVLLEEGCEEFSNIAGLGQIRFAKGNIAAAFEEVRRLLEREGLI